MACPVHENPKIMVCIPCKSAVCDVCIEADHIGHQFQTLKSAAENVIGDLKKSVEIQDYMKIEKEFEHLSAKCQTEKEHAVRTKQELLDRRDQIKQVLDHVTEKAVIKLEQHNNFLFEELDKVKNNAEEKCKAIRDFKDDVQRLTTSHMYLDVLEKGWKMNPPVIIPLEYPNVSTLIFTPGTPVDETNIDMLFGQLEHQDLDSTFHNEGKTSSPEIGQVDTNMFSTPSICSADLFGEGPEGDPPHLFRESDESTQLKSHSNIQRLKCDVTLDYQHSFEHDSTVRVMKPTTGGKCWISHYGGKPINLVDKNGDIIEVIPDEIDDVRDVFCSPVKNRILMAHCKKKCIKRVTIKENKNKGKTSFATSPWARTEPLRPYSLCMAPNGDIIVGLTDKKSWSKEPDSTSVLVRYNRNGKELARVEKDGHGQDLFVCPFKISTNTTGSVAVVNFTKERLGASHLVLLDNNLNLTHRYIAHGVTLPAEDPLPELTGKLAITDVLFNHQNLILVSEGQSRTVQLLDPMCNLLKVLVTDLQTSPISLALHGNGDLWVGLRGGELQVFQHTIDFVPEGNKHLNTN
ncbi:uncharacterized protein LOC117317507 [Pecten maximus]|uniref:uncharacterized protein LOC117317507 n=1 Tax=Pecten maximus TaxID=6579 RepID=UPI001457F216|nr:uncharacterized protein LOC117317507 [Pecten maximus]